MSHIAILVSNLERSKHFYKFAFGMQVVWENEEKAYLCAVGGGDILGIQVSNEFLERRFDLTQIDPLKQGTPLFDHFGIVTTEETAFQETRGRVIELGAIVTDPKTSRDGTCSIYFKDPDGYVLQVTLVPNHYFGQKQ